MIVTKKQQQKKQPFYPKTQNKHFNIYIPENVHEHTKTFSSAVRHTNSVKGGENDGVNSPKPLELSKT